MPLDSLGYAAPVGYVETKIVDADGEVLRRLRRAVEILEQNGWVQKDFGAAGGPRCLGGAYFQAYQELGGTYVAPWDLTGFGGRHVDGCRAMVDWNNAPGRTKTEVIARLRSAAEQGAS